MNTSVKITLAFLIFGVAWICFTDLISLSASNNNLKVYYEIQTFKGILFILLSAVLIFFVSRKLNNSIVRGNKDLTETNNQLAKMLEDKVNYQRKIAQAIINVQEAERKLLGEELHDNITQILATTKLYLGLAMEKPDMNEELIKKSSNNIVEVITELRNLSKSLTPPSLEDLGLIPSIEDLAHSFSQSKKINIDFNSVDFNEQWVSKEKKTVLYRIIQEQLNNIVRYTNAKYVTIALSNDEDRIIVTVWNDGIFRDARLASDNIGLENIRNRIELFNGFMELNYSGEEGATLKVEI
ncbi:MAG: hypothetical protein INR73_24550 [Williamsia sp.]|nr:hypothetical protein [Williamsia sp.]